MTIKEYAATHGISESAARARLEKAVAAGAMRKVVYDEMVSRRSHRGYFYRNMPVKVAHYFTV